MAKAFLEKKIDDATPEEVKEFASRFLGIPTAELTDGQIAAKVRAATETDMIYVSVPPEEQEMTGHPPIAVEDDVAAKLQGGLGHSDPQVKLILHNEEKDGVIVSRHKEVGVNGVVWLLKRGTEITIPYRVYLALNNAARDVITHDGTGEVMTQTVKSTPFNVTKLPTDDEVAAWEKRTATQFVPS